MLVLTRKSSEQIIIGDNIRLTIVRVRGNTVRIGIDAPKDIRVMRAEVQTKQDSLGPSQGSFDQETEIDGQAMVFAHSDGGSQKELDPEVKVPSRMMERTVHRGKVNLEETGAKVRLAPLASYMSAT